ncbi:NAD(P)H-binding protein [Streptomyces yunnanensis]|uniref:NAD(P)H-binding protein n=1 Tax=Streptomyces yunnanensis TaxID=156453 RepID=UPI0023B1ABBD|nr:NAD(P)H-binding protein [Streptomyces yunnanensis]
MSAVRRILVTGATGNVGRRVTAGLVAAGAYEVRALTRCPETAALPPVVEVRRGDLSDAAGLTAASEGVDAVFLMWPFHSAEPADAVVAAIGRHADRVVFLSSGSVQDGVEPAAQSTPVGRWHRAVERRIEESVPAWTHLRPSAFAANTRWWAGQVRAGDAVRGAFGALPTLLLHEADIADVAVRALTEGGHAGAAYALTGPEVLTQAQQVRIIGEVLGRPLRWEELSRDAARRQLLADDGFPDTFVDPLLDGYAQMMTAPRPTVTGTVEAVTGAPARTYREWVAEHAADFV